MDKGIKDFHSGANGALVSDGNNIYEVDGIKPRALVDTVCAGDCFAAGFLRSIIQKETLEKALKFANAIGSIVVGVEGGNEGLPYYEDVLVHIGLSKKVER